MRMIIRALFQPFAIFAGAFVAMVFLILFGPMIQGAWEERTPASRWMEYRRFHVNDAKVGTSPIIDVERVVHQQFLATTRGTLRRVVSDPISPIFEENIYEPICARGSTWHFIPNSILPERATLDFLLEVPPNEKCLADRPGFFVVTLWVTISVEGSARRKTLQVVSNVFEVTP